MTTIQDRIIKDFRKEFVCQPYSDKDKIVAKLVGDTTYCWLPETIEQFLIQSIKLVQEETRKEVFEECKQKMAQSNEWWNKKFLSITNKDKQ